MTRFTKVEEDDAHLLPAAAIDQVEAWFESASLVLIAETQGYSPELRSALEQGRISPNSAVEHERGANLERRRHPGVLF